MSSGGVVAGRRSLLRLGVGWGVRGLPELRSNLFPEGEHAGGGCNQSKAKPLGANKFAPGDGFTLKVPEVVLTGVKHVKEAGGGRPTIGAGLRAEGTVEGCKEGEEIVEVMGRIGGEPIRGGATNQ